jgi:hypothetical protein
MYTWSFTVLVWYVHVPDQYSERSCIHVLEVSIFSLFLWYFLLLLLLMYMYQTSTVNNHVYMGQRYRLFLFLWYNNNKRYHRNRETIDTSDTCIHDPSLYWSGTWPVMYTCVRGIDCFSVSMIYFIIIIINVHVPDQYSERSCIHGSEVLIVSLFLSYILFLLLMYMYQTSTVTGHVYMCQRYWLIIIIKDIIETEKQSIPLTHVYMTVHCTGLVHVH